MLLDNLLQMGIVRVGELELTMAWLVEHGPVVLHPPMPNWALRRLVDTGRILRLRRDVYLAPTPEGKLPPLPAVLGSLAADGYISFATALAHHGFTDQDPGRWVVVSPTRRAPLRYGRLTVSFHLSSHKATSAATIEELINGVTVRYATPTKAFLDILETPQLGPELGSLVGAFRAGVEGGRLDLQEFRRDLLMTGSLVMARRGGLLIELACGITDKALLQRARRSHSWSTVTSSRGERDSRWYVILPDSRARILARAS